MFPKWTWTQRPDTSKSFSNQSRLDLNGHPFIRIISNALGWSKESPKHTQRLAIIAVEDDPSASITMQTLFIDSHKHLVMYYRHTSQIGGLPGSLVVRKSQLARHQFLTLSRQPNKGYTSQCASEDFGITMGHPNELATDWYQHVPSPSAEILHWPLRGIMSKADPAKPSQ